MRGERTRQVGMLTLMSPERLVPKDHPIRRIKVLADAQLVQLSGVFDQMCAQRGRPSIPPETLLKAQLLIALYSVRSERQFVSSCSTTCSSATSSTWGWTKGPSANSTGHRNAAANIAAGVR
jgi:hypothetical protein